MLKFFCFDPLVLKEMPIISISEYKFNWVDKARKYYEHFRSDIQVTKCPGIFSLLNKGWIQRTYQDFTIETNGDNNYFKVYYEIDQTKRRGGKYTSDYIAFHDREQLQMFRNCSENTLHSIIKIQSPWFVKIPKGYSLLMMPVPYSDDIRFTAVPGLLKNNNSLNVQLFWHCKNSKELIKKGTPLNHMILIKDESNDYSAELIEDMENFMKEIYNK